MLCSLCNRRGNNVDTNEFVWSPDGVRCARWSLHSISTSWKFNVYVKYANSTQIRENGRNDGSLAYAYLQAYHNFSQSIFLLTFRFFFTNERIRIRKSNVQEPDFLRLAHCSAPDQTNDLALFLLSVQWSRILYSIRKKKKNLISHYSHNSNTMKNSVCPTGRSDTQITLFHIFIFFCLRIFLLHSVIMIVN